MADIKTRDAVKGTIKTIDKAAIASERMKSAYAKTKDKAEQGYYAEENSATEYAADKISHTADRVKDEGIHQFNKQGQKSVQTTKENIIKAKDKVAEFKTKRNCEPFSCPRCSRKWEKPVDKDPSAGEKDHQDHRQKCGKDREIYGKRHGQGSGKRRKDRTGNL